MATFSIDATTWRAKQYSTRYDDIWAFIVHSCEGKPAGDEQQSSLPWLCGYNDVSCDYYVTREGKIYRLVDERYYSWHAGDSSLSGVRYCNTYSIGVELEHRQGAAPYPVIQKDALTWLAQYCINRYAIQKQNISTHRQVAKNVGRTDKYDPTDWSDTLFYQWVDSLYVPLDPLRAKQLPPAPNTPARYTTVELYNFYNARGGVQYNGYALRDAFRAYFGVNNEEAIIQVNERTVMKQSARYGVEQALIQEAIAEGWV